MEIRGKRQEMRKGLKRLARVVCVLFVFSVLLPIFAQQGYTNHAGNVIAGWPVALTSSAVTLGEEGRKTGDVRRVSYPLSIFPESERRRIAADFGEPRVPLAVKRAIAGAEKAMARSRKRAEKGFCTKEESEAFCAKSSAALRSYLDKQVESGVITPAERKAIGR